MVDLPQKNAERPAWLRLPREPESCYALFKLYRGTDSIDDEDPEILRAAKKDKEAKLYIETWQPTDPCRDHQLIKKKTQYSILTLHHYSSKWSWKARARQYDLYVSRRTMDDVEADGVRLMDRMERVRSLEVGRVLSAVEKMRKKADTIADYPVFTEFTEAPVVVERYPDGREKTVIHTHWHPAGWSVRDAATLNGQAIELMKYLFDLMYGPEGEKRPSREGATFTPDEAAVVLKALATLGPKGIGYDGDGGGGDPAR